MKSNIHKKLEIIANCIYAKYNCPHTLDKIGIYDGICGIILFLFYYSQYTKEKKYRKLAEELSEEMLCKIFNNIPTYSSGLAGILYLFIYLHEHKFIDINIEEYSKEITAFLNKNIDDYIKNNKYDFMHGALGIGLYFLKANKSPKSIYTLIDYLYHSAEKDKEQKIFKWESIIDYKKGISGYNISLSHGLSSIIIFLCRSIDYGFHSEKAILTLTGAINYILSQEYKEKDGLSLFPSQSTENETEKKYSRLAWCYGDLGIGISLLYAGITTQNREWENKGMYILERSTFRTSLSKNSVIDAGICHGSAGISMIYNRLYINTHKECFHMAYNYWINITLQMSHFQDGLAGYKSFYPQGWLQDYSLLTGISGIGLVLLSNLYQDRQEWDELFIINFKNKGYGKD